MAARHAARTAQHRAPPCHSRRSWWRWLAFAHALTLTAVQSADCPEGPPPEPLHVATLHPQGGPVYGGTVVTVIGRGFRTCNLSAPARCRFGFQDVVDATVLNETTMLCSGAPAVPPEGGYDASSLNVNFEVSVGSSEPFSRSGRLFTYVDYSHISISTITPSGGPRSGGTRLTITGHGLRDLGASLDMGLSCHLGENVAARGRLLDGGFTLECIAPQDLNWPPMLPPMPPGVPPPPPGPPSPPARPTPALPPQSSPPSGVR